jgi:hypothetical protein
VKSIFFSGSAGRDWYTLRQRLLICVGNLVLWNKNEQSIFQEEVTKLDSVSKSLIVAIKTHSVSISYRFYSYAV